MDSFAGDAKGISRRVLLGEAVAVAAGTTLAPGRVAAVEVKNWNTGFGRDW
jgi:hypothetical protein